MLDVSLLFQPVRHNVDVLAPRLCIIGVARCLRDLPYLPSPQILCDEYVPAAEGSQGASSRESGATASCQLPATPNLTPLSSDSRPAPPRHAEDVFMPPDEFKKFATELGCNRCTGLQALCMDWTNLEAPAELASALRTNTTLSALDINNACLSQDDTQQLAEGIAENGRRSDGCISSIDLSNNDMRAGGAAAIVASLVGNPRVTSLRLAYNNLGVEGAKAMAKFLPGVSLTSLNLSGNALRDGGIKALAKALEGSGCIHIAELSLAHNGVTDSSVKCLADSLVQRKACGVQGLGMLNVGYNMIRAAGARALSFSSENGAGPNKLILRGNPIGDAGARALSRAAANGGLTAADLHSCGIRTDGATALAKALEQATCVLSSLDIGGNAVRALGAEAIAAALREGARWTLSSLDISRNGLGLEGVSKLASSVALSSSLVHLNARNNAVPERELSELRKKVGCGGEALEMLSEAHVLALCMSGHKRLGNRSCAGWIDGALLHMIASLTDTIVPRSVHL